MNITNTQNCPLLKFSNLSKEKEITHFVSSRQGGTSRGDYESLNLSFSAGDDFAHVKRNRQILAEAAGISPDKFVFQNQQHGHKVRVAKPADCKNFTEHTYSFSDSDALISNRPGICLFVFAADCVPIFLYDKKEKVIAAVHSGWRGTAEKILQHTLDAVKENYSSRAENILAGIGPAIRAENYEVGREVAAAFYGAYGKAAEEFIFTPKGKKEHLDLYAANRYLLRKNGVPDAQIETSQYCTFENSELFFSARRKRQSGRFGVGIMLNAQ
jgi:YfiH family protein